MKPWLKKILAPQHWLKAHKRKNKQPVSRGAADPQLQLYDRILQTDFLHYGYFDDPDLGGSSISFDMLRHAQIRYAEHLLDTMQAPKNSRVLDVGCGMGGLLNMLVRRGYHPTGLTPDKNQIQYIQHKQPDVPLIHARFQDIDAASYQGAFETIIFSESFQYIDASTALHICDGLLNKGNEIIIVDYFRTGDAHEASGHRWAAFEKILNDAPFTMTHREDISDHIRATLNFAHFLATRFGQSLFAFLTTKLEQKHPAKHYFLEELLEEWEKKLSDNIKTIDPGHFCDTKRYYLLRLEKV